MHILAAVPQKERKARGKGISVYKVDGDNWELVQILEGQVNPSYLCLNKAQDRLYSIHGDFCQVSAFRSGKMVP